MHRILNALYVLLAIFYIYISICSSAFAVGLGNPTANVAAPRPIQNNAGASRSNQNTMAAVGYHSLRKNLETQPQQVMLSQNNSDCLTTTYMVPNSHDQNIQCPHDYVPVALDSTPFYTPAMPASASQMTSGPTSTRVQYYLRCCRAKAAYS